MERSAQIYERFKKSGLAQTTAKTAVYLTFAILAHPKLIEMGIPIGTGATKEDHEVYRKNMPLYASIATIAAPIIEESLFRFIPSLITSKRSTSWRLGTAASLVFALAHNLKTNENNNTTLETKKIPLWQFVSGLLFWHIAKKHGIKNAIISHSLINGTALTLYAINERNIGARK